jgi:hypothetical protein
MYVNSPSRFAVDLVFCESDIPNIDVDIRLCGNCHEILVRRPLANDFVTDEPIEHEI